ncbi:helix-turn-helix domain-containing protein [Nonomuraea sp. B12E4]|uniref:helix-turn-helix domain-containing protein n=1 Tax=Nonomuraea sp. B12E4 TaxID=3153564 RepID=UPI00325D5BC5
MDVSDDGTAASMVALIPRTLVPLPPNKVDRLLATRLPGQDGVGALLVQFLARLAADSASFRPTDGPRLGTVLLDLFTVLLAPHLDADAAVPPESRQRTLLLRVQTFVRRHLAEPDLSPAAVAAAHNISVRTLHRLFESEEVTVAAWIRAQRLEGCRRDLADPRHAGRPIFAIAARWGFTDAATLSRAARWAARDAGPGEVGRHGAGVRGVREIPGHGAPAPRPRARPCRDHAGGRSRCDCRPAQPHRSARSLASASWSNPGTRRRWMADSGGHTPWPTFRR